TPLTPLPPLLFSFSMRRPPRSTHFPYTTLFRSMARSRIICHNRIRTTSRWPAVAAGLAYRSLNLATHAANIDHFFVAQNIVIRVDNRIRGLEEELAATLALLL